MTQTQIKVLKRLAAGEQTTCKQWASKRALLQRGLIEETNSYPFVPRLTEEGRKALSN